MGVDDLFLERAKLGKTLACQQFIVVRYGVSRASTVARIAAQLQCSGTDFVTPEPHSGACATPMRRQESCRSRESAVASQVLFARARNWRPAWRDRPRGEASPRRGWDVRSRVARLRRLA